FRQAAVTLASWSLTTSSTSRIARSRSSSGYFRAAPIVPLSRGLGASTKPGAIQLRDVGMLTLTQIAGRLGVSTGTVKTWHHAGLITGHPFNDKGECLYPPPGQNP